MTSPDLPWIPIKNPLSDHTLVWRYRNWAWSERL